MSPAPGVPVARWWNDQNLPTLPPDLAYWQPRGVHGLTNTEGLIGIGMGEGDGYDPGWSIIDLPVSENWAGPNSARIDGLGWAWGTEHLRLDPTFQLVPPGPEPPGDLKAKLLAVIGHLQAMAEMV